MFVCASGRCESVAEFPFLVLQLAASAERAESEVWMHTEMGRVDPKQDLHSRQSSPR